MSRSTTGVTELISAERIAVRVDDLASDVVAARAPGGDEPLVMVVLLKGAFVFAADLLRALDRHGACPEVEFLAVSSYGAGTEGSGEVRVSGNLSASVKGRDVLLVDDILDTGRSLATVRDVLMAQGARQVLTCVLLDKPSRRVVDIRADFVGFEVPDRFVIGYGLDWDQRYRHLPFVGLLDGL